LRFKISVYRALAVKGAAVNLKQYCDSVLQWQREKTET